MAKNNAPEKEIEKKVILSFFNESSNIYYCIEVLENQKQCPFALKNGYHLESLRKHLKVKHTALFNKKIQEKMKDSTKNGLVIF